MHSKLTAPAALWMLRENTRDAKKDKKAALTDLYQKLRLEQAKLYVLIWQLGGYEEDEHPDVVYRDRALDIAESEALFDMKEAKALRAVIYTHILDRWYWIEGRQTIQNHKQKRKDLQKKLECPHPGTRRDQKIMNDPAPQASDGQNRRHNQKRAARRRGRHR